MKKTISSILATAIGFAPVVAFAQFGGINDFLNQILTFISGTLIPLIFAAALLVFIYGMFQYFILGRGDEGAIETGRRMMIWSVVGFVAMVSIFGVVNLVAGGLGFSSQRDIQNIPHVPTTNN